MFAVQTSKGKILGIFSNMGKAKQYAFRRLWSKGRQGQVIPWNG